jgi:hypothetical protein
MTEGRLGDYLDHIERRHAMLRRVRGESTDAAGR